MSAWTETTLGEACELYQPQTISSAELVADGNYPVYGANGIIGKYDKFNHEESQLLVTCRGATCGTVNISQPYAWINGNAMVVRPRNDSLDLKYLAQLFRGGLDLTVAITGAAQPQITRQSLAPLRIRIPTLPEQRRIALALLDSLTQSLFLDMFGDAETNKMGFQISTLGSAIKLKSGNFLPASQMADKGQFPVYGGNGINGKHDEFMFEEPKIVIGRVGAYCGCVHVTESQSWVTDNALYIEIFDSALQPEYLAFALSEAKLNQYASQSGQPLISGARIAAVKLLIPPPPPPTNLRHPHRLHRSPQSHPPPRPGRAGCAVCLAAAASVCGAVVASPLAPALDRQFAPPRTGAHRTCCNVFTSTTSRLFRTLS